MSEIERGAWLAYRKWVSSLMADEAAERQRQAEQLRGAGAIEQEKASRLDGVRE